MITGLCQLLPGSGRKNQKKLQNDFISPNPIKINLRPKSSYETPDTRLELSKEISEDLVQNDSIPLQPIKVNTLSKSKTETFPEIISKEKLMEIIETSKEASKDSNLPKTNNKNPTKIETLEISKESSEYLDRYHSYIT